MKFILHQYSTNNGIKLGDYKHPTKSWVPSESDIRITDRGLTFFNVPEQFTIAQKLEFAQRLECALASQFRHGFSAVSTAESDCSTGGEMVDFFEGVKRSIPNIKTIFASATKIRKSDEWIGLPDKLNPDHKIDWYSKNPTAADIMTQIVGATDDDKTIPVNGWDKYEELLEQLHRQATQAALQLNQL